MVEPTPLAINIQNVSLWYGDFQALFEVDLQVKRGSITALIGPSGCGKTTLLRAVNRINERLGDYVRTTGEIHVLDQDILGDEVELAQLRRHVGMVFQRPNPLPLSVRDNVLFAHRIHRANEKFNKQEEDEIVESALRRVLLWDEVKDRLTALGSMLSGGQQQRLTIARALSQNPELLLLDEFSIAVDPVTTMRIEDVLKELKQEVTIILVTNLVQQARRLADRTAFFLSGELIEVGETEDLFSGKVKDQRTLDYLEGRFG